jgi:cation:H+ antiporter
MVAASLACVPVFLTGRRITRPEGWLLLFYYAAYTLFLVLEGQHHDAAKPFGTAMLAFVVPITAIALVVLAVRSARRDRVRP